MSGRYIDADAIIQEAHHERKTIVTVELIESMPTADVRENVHGEWVNTRPPEMSDNIVCSVCGYDSIASYSFCPNCGADMRKGEKDDSKGTD